MCVCYIQILTIFYRDLGICGLGVPIGGIWNGPHTDIKTTISLLCYFSLSSSFLQLFYFRFFLVQITYILFYAFSSSPSGLTRSLSRSAEFIVFPAHVMKSWVPNLSVHFLPTLIFEWALLNGSQTIVCRGGGYMSTFMSVCACMVGAYVCTEGLTSTFGIFLYHAPPYCLRQGLSRNLELISWARLAGWWVSGITPHPHLVRITSLHHYAPSLYTGARDPNSSLCV